MRHWNVYLYNHAHVDIGYTNTHKNVELLHKNNIIEGIKLAEETKNHPDGARLMALEKRIIRMIIPFFPGRCGITTRWMPMFLLR